VTLTLPSNAVPGRCSVVALVQDAASMRILAAARTALGAAGSISGRVLGPTGVGVVGVIVQACTQTECIPARTDADGAFTLTGVPAGPYTVTAQGVSPGVTVVVAAGGNETVTLHQSPSG